MTTAATGGVLVIGYGNGLRSDDGVGPAVAARLAGDSRLAGDPRLAGADVRVVHQLTPELALDASRVSLLVLVDASADAPAGEVVVTRLDPEGEPGEAGGAMTHHLDPAGLVGLERELWGVAPPVVVVSVGIASLEAGERLTPTVEAAVPRAVDAVAAIIERHARA